MWLTTVDLLGLNFIPHGHCYLWKPGLVALHLGSDILTSIAYYFVAIAVFLTRKRWQDLSQETVILLIGVFWVFAGCGTVHILNGVTLWYPIYWISGAVKITNGLWSTYVFVFFLIPLIPIALEAPTPAQMEEANSKLAAANQEISYLMKKLKAENIRMSTELDIVRQIQQLVLPNSEELEIEGLDIAGYMEPANEVGGDYYDVLNADGIVTIGMGDVTGHGLESGILMLMTQTAVRTLKEVRERDPVKFLDALNRTIYKNVQRMNSDKNLTLVVLNYADGKVSISGQHEETIVVRKGGWIERIDTMDLGFPIGLDIDIADFISHRIVELQPGDGIVLYTDGITEAKNINKKRYGLQQLCEVIAQNWELDANDIKQAAIEDLHRHIGSQKVFDDITLLVLKQEATTRSQFEVIGS